jgi:hypothetical protein
MTTAKIAGTAGASAIAGLAPYVDDLYDHPGKRVIIIGELRHVEKTVPIDDTEREPSVKLMLTELEVASGNKEEPVRDALVALYQHRTAHGTLTEHGDVQIAEATLRSFGGDVHAIEAARLGVAIKVLREHAVDLLANPDISTGQLRNNLRKLINRFDTVMQGGEVQPHE